VVTDSLPGTPEEQRTRAIIDRHVSDAARILTHYFNQAIPDGKVDFRQDLHAEMRDVVQSIVSAAVLSVKKELNDSALISPASRLRP
jgi:hypothetical protein